MGKATTTMKKSVKATSTVKNFKSGSTVPVINKTKITYGCDFAGLGTMGLGLKKYAESNAIGVDITVAHVFSCDKSRASKKFIEYTDKPAFWYNNILGRVLVGNAAKSLSVYSFTAPCQGLSPAGKQHGDKDPRTCLALCSIAYLEKYTPKSFMSENVSALAKQKKFEVFFKFLLSSLEKAGYVVGWKILNSCHYVPQNRERVYIMGVRTDVRRKLTRGVSLFPEPPSKPLLRLADIVKPVPATLWKTHPITKNDGKNVMNAYRKVQSEINPFMTPIVVDAKASESFTSHRVNESPTLTRTRCASFGYWCSTKGSYLDIDEFITLQGFNRTDVPWREAGLTKSAIAGALGNGQTLSVVSDLLPHLLFHSSQITYAQFESMKAFCASSGAPTQ